MWNYSKLINFLHRNSFGTHKIVMLLLQCIKKGGVNGSVFLLWLGLSKVCWHAIVVFLYKHMEKVQLVLIFLHGDMQNTPFAHAA